MRFRIYINYLQGNGVHAGVMASDYVFYVRDVEPDVSVPLKGYIELSLDTEVPVSRVEIESVVREAFLTIGKPEENSFHMIETNMGQFEMLFREGLPDNPDAVISELMQFASRAIEQGRNRQV